MSKMLDPTVVRQIKLIDERIANKTADRIAERIPVLNRRRAPHQQIDGNGGDL